MKKIIIILSIAFSITAGFSQNISVNLTSVGIFRETNALKITVTNNSQYPVIIFGFGRWDGADNVIGTTSSYSYCYILQDYLTVLKTSRIKYFRSPDNSRVSVLLAPGQSYEIIEPFLTNKGMKGFFESEYGTFLIKVTVHIKLLYCAVPNEMKEMNITSNSLTIWNTNSVFEDMQPL